MSQDSQNSLITNTESDPSQSEEKFVKLYRLPSDELLTSQVKQRMDVIQSLTEPCDRKTYSIKKREAAEKLGVSIRQVERLLQKWRQQGLVGLTATRSDKGKYRIEQEWSE